MPDIGTQGLECPAGTPKEGIPKRKEPAERRRDSASLTGCGASDILGDEG